MSCTDLVSYDFILREGFDKTINFRSLDGDRVPINLTGSTMLFNCSLDNLDQQAIITDATEGKFSIGFSSAQISGLVQRRVKYEMSREISGVKTPLFIGSINITKGVA